MQPYRVSHSGGDWGAPPYLTIFFKNSPPKPMLALWGTPPLPHLKMKLPPSEKQPPPLKHDTPFYEMIPRKSTINNNLKSS